MWLRDHGETEIGAFGISSPDDLLLIKDIKLVRQECTSVSVMFDDAAVADFFDEQVDGGRRPEEFGRIWIHTHPGDSAQPSSTDERTFARCFGNTDWSVMFIVAVGGETYARLQFNAGPATSVVISVDVDFSSEFDGSNYEEWWREYQACVASLEPSWWDMDVVSPSHEHIVAPDEEEWLLFYEPTIPEEVYLE